MAIPASVIFCWNGTHAGIPAGWERETTLDAKYPKGTALSVDPNVTGGAASHTHTVTNSHTHTAGAHTHTTTVANSSGGGVTTGATVYNSTAPREHPHATVVSGAVSDSTVSSETPSYSSFANDPPYHEVVFIKPTNPVNGLVDDGICFVDTSSTLGFTFCDGANSTPDLRNKYLKGAATNGDAGTTGGTYTNTHAITHTHTTSHTQVTASVLATTTHAIAGKNEATFNVAHINHTHTATFTAATPSLDDNPSIVTAETVEPAYMKLIPVQNKTGDLLEVVGMIGMWLGTLANIPSGWSELPIMRGKHLKCANTTAEAGTSGGANSHTHAAQYHTHSSVSHDHAVTISAHTHGYKSYTGDNSGGVGANSSTTHTATTDSVGLTTSNTSTTANSSSNEPAYRTVAFIKLTNIISGGSFLFSML